KVTRRVSLISALKNTLLSLLKIIIGYFGHSHALVADGLHSISDLITDGLTLVAAKAGGQVPDKEHPYGHQRIETIAAIIIAFILIFVAATIGYHALHHLFSGEALEKPNISVIIIAFISVIVNEWLYRYTLFAGKKVASNLLISSAWHNRSDAFV